MRHWSSIRLGGNELNYTAGRRVYKSPKRGAIGSPTGLDPAGQNLYPSPAMLILRRSIHIAVVLLGIFTLWASLGVGQQTDGTSAKGSVNGDSPILEAKIGPASPATELLILRNGQVIEGRITRTEGRYVVVFPDGQVQIKTADVEMVCGSLEEGYRIKRAAIQAGNVYQHVDLAQWCIKQRLLDHAAAELAAAKAAEPSNPIIATVEHRLKIAQESPQMAEAARKAPAGPSSEELDRMMRGLPRGAVETFTQSVQPLLMNHCATGGCHGPQSDGSLRLFRSASGNLVSRRITQRNLYAVLKHIDRDKPLESRLLTASSNPHGTAKYAIFSERETGQYKRMVDWVQQLVEQPNMEAPLTVLSEEAANARPLPLAKQAKAKPSHRGANPSSFNQPVNPPDPNSIPRVSPPNRSEIKN
jgi:hypothetical protein